MQKQVRITSKGRITVPIEVRRILGVRAGDHLLFESDSDGVHIRSVRSQSVFEKYRGIGNPGIGSGRKAINRWQRELRGKTRGK
jgi:AbrB family looped-hinge helix DNA binding protein